MFDFEKPGIYLKAKAFNNIFFVPKPSGIDAGTKDPVQIASFIVQSNIAECSGLYSIAELKNCFVIGRGFVFD